MPRLSTCGAREAAPDGRASCSSHGVTSREGSSHALDLRRRKRPAGPVEGHVVVVASIVVADGGEATEQHVGDEGEHAEDDQHAAAGRQPVEVRPAVRARHVGDVPRRAVVAEQVGGQAHHEDTDRTSSELEGTRARSTAVGRRAWAPSGGRRRWRARSGAPNTATCRCPVAHAVPPSTSLTAATTTLMTATATSSRAPTTCSSGQVEARGCAGPAAQPEQGQHADGYDHQRR